MSAAGVTDIVHVMDSKSASKDVKDIGVNVANLEKACAAVPAPTRCRLVNTDDASKNDLAFDGIHPIAAANDRVAKVLVDLMAGVSRCTRPAEPHAHASNQPLLCHAKTARRRCDCDTTGPPCTIP